MIAFSFLSRVRFLCFFAAPSRPPSLTLPGFSVRGREATYPAHGVVEKLAFLCARRIVKLSLVFFADDSVPFLLTHIFAIQKTKKTRHARENQTQLPVPLHRERHSLRRSGIHRYQGPRRFSRL